MSQHKSFPTRGQAIVDYQGCLLRGTVILYNEKVEIDDDDEGWW